METANYISASKITKQFDVSSGSLRRWAEEGKIRFLRPNKGKRIYHIEDIVRIFGNKKENLKETILYAQVSSSHQKQDLERQTELLKTNYPNGKVITDVASGLNWRRHGFNALLERVHSGSVETVVVTYKDRLCRFGLELVEWIFSKYNTKLVVLNQRTDTSEPSTELSEDLLAVVNVFVAKNNGLRAGALKRARNAERKADVPNTKAALEKDCRWLATTDM